MSTLPRKILFVAVSAMMILLINPLLLSSSSSLEGFTEYYSEEREALLMFRDNVSSNSSNLHSNWTGPPCITNSSRWSGIACSNGHVVHLVLEGIQLAATIAEAAGSLPPTFLHNITFLRKVSFRNNTFSGHLPNLSNLVHLEYVDFSCNRFWGSIPLAYSTELPNLELLELQENSLDGPVPPFDQPTLRAFNVSHNDLEGPIPNTGVLQKFPKSSYDHNKNLCGSPLGTSCSPPPPPISPPPSNPNLPEWSIALIVAAAAVLPFCFLFVFLFYYRKAQPIGKDDQADLQTGTRVKKMPVDDHLDDPEKMVELEFFDQELPPGVFFDLDDLLRASAEVMGKGKLATSYKVTLESGVVVVVKRLRSMNDRELRKKEFVQQMQLLGNMRHENLAQILSFYYSREEKLVIYKFVSGATTLYDLLHENKVGEVGLDWATRLSIIKNIAKGLTFLHQSLRSHKVPHANLKSSNVLVVLGTEENYHVKLTDYGLLPLLSAQKYSQTSGLAIGHSPELAQGKKPSRKADVYCFGIVLLEIITGKIPGKVSSGSDETIDNLSDWVRMVVNNDWSTDIFDVEMLAAKDDHDDMLKLTSIALECTDIAPEKRPKMIQVLKSIQEIE